MRERVIIDSMAGRPFAVRMPFSLAASGFLICSIWALPTLSTCQIEATGGSSAVGGRAFRGVGGFGADPIRRI